MRHLLVLLILHPSITKGWVKSSVVSLAAMRFDLNKLNMLELFVTVGVIFAPDPASSDTNNDLITAVLATRHCI